MVNILFRQKAVEPALKLWREISAKMPNLTANSYYVVASNLDHIGNTKGAAELYNMAIEKYKDDVVLPYCYARLVYFRMQAGEDVKAVYEFVKGPLQKFKGMDGLPEISLLLGEYNYQNDKIEEALKYYKKSLSISKGQIGVETRFKLAGCYFKLNKYKEALSVYVQVAFVYSSNKILAEEALFKAGRCAELAGNNADAAKYYKKYFEMYPAGRFKTEVESRNKNIKGGR
jgi:tetratricopeptide (TPR) repeat protein